MRLFVDDALTVLADSGQFDLVFADAPAGKWEGLERTIEAVRPGGHLVVDDMRPPGVDKQHQVKIMELRRRLLAHPDLVSAEMAWASGVILSTRRRGSQAAGA